MLQLGVLSTLGNPVNLEVKEGDKEAEEDAEAVLDQAVKARMQRLQQLSML